jgi:hypothetical protein
MNGGVATLAKPESRDAGQRETAGQTPANARCWPSGCNFGGNLHVSAVVRAWFGGIWRLHPMITGSGE